MDDGRSQVGPSGLAVAGVVRPDEPFEGPLPVRLRHARPVCGTPGPSSETSHVTVSPGPLRQAIRTVVMA
ncbi:hypothetical protein JCM4914_00680 [Streptomyces platensis subsp. malvinus]